ncbi:TRI25 ligase, partial [Polypterus senegalus]
SLYLFLLRLTMAEAQMFVSEDEFTCSICLDTLTDPVSLHCGHSYCLKCLKDCWDQKEECSCPQCRETFTTRPTLQRNTLLNEVIKKLKKTEISPPSPSQNYAGPGDVECDFCTGKKFRAVNSCLMCMASFCQTHLQPHYEGLAWKHHKLIDPDGNLQEKLCAKHQKSLEIFCKTDDLCICMMCVVTGHKSHEMVELEMEREVKEKQLGATLSDIKRKLEEREEKLKEIRRAMEQMTISVEKEVEEHEKSFNDLIHCIEENHRRLIEKIREQEKKEMEKAEEVVKHLEEEIEELKRKDSELKELSETKDNILFLQDARLPISHDVIFLSWSAVNAVSVKWKHLGERRAAQVQSDKTLKTCEHRVLKHIKVIHPQTYSSRCVLPADGDSLSFTVTADFSSEHLRTELSCLKKNLEKINRWDVMTWTPSDHSQEILPGPLIVISRLEPMEEDLASSGPYDVTSGLEPLVEDPYEPDPFDLTSCLPL